MKLIIEGFGLGGLLYLVCAFGIRNGALGMVHLYSAQVKERVVELGLIDRETIRKRGFLFKAFCIPAYIIYVIICVYGINKAQGFWQGALQSFVILFIMDLVDRLAIDEYWVCHTHAWDIPGTEDLKPYISSEDKKKKWISATLSCVLLSILIAGIGSLIQGI